jgi:uncharacterized protein (DUF433 family)
MNLVPDPLPLKLDEHGVIRVAGTRVALDTILHHFLMGYSPEHICESFPTVPPGTVYAVLAHYLNHRPEFDEYLRQGDAQAQEIRRQIEAMPGQAQFRERLLARKAAMQAADLEAQKA